MRKQFVLRKNESTMYHNMQDAAKEVHNTAKEVFITLSDFIRKEWRS